MASVPGGNDREVIEIDIVSAISRRALAEVAADIARLIGRKFDAVVHHHGHRHNEENKE